MFPAVINTHSFIYHRRCIILSTDSVVKQNISLPLVTLQQAADTVTPVRQW